MNYLALIFALLSALSASLVAIFGKIGLKNIDSNTATAIRAIIMAIFLMAVVIVQGKLNQIPVIASNKKALGYIALTGIAGATSWLFYFLALRYGKVSLVAPVDKLSVVIAVLLAAIFLGEKISLVSGLGIVLLAAGVILIAIG